MRAAARLLVLLAAAAMGAHLSFAGDAGGERKQR